MFSIIKARVRPMVTRKTEKVAVTKACEREYFSKACASMPPEDEATIRVTTGSSHSAVILSRVCFCPVSL